jgi:hypothetical protein
MNAARRFSLSLIFVRPPEVHPKRVNPIRTVDCGMLLVLGRTDGGCCRRRRGHRTATRGPTASPTGWPTRSQASCRSRQGTYGMRRSLTSRTWRASAAVKTSMFRPPPQLRTGRSLSPPIVTSRKSRLGWCKHKRSLSASLQLFLGSSVCVCTTKQLVASG